MKLLLDENISSRMPALIAERFDTVTHVKAVGLTGVEDTSIWKYAIGEGYTIVTKDNDFRFLGIVHGCPPKVVQLRCGNRTTAFIAELLKKEASTMQVFNASPDCYLEIH